MNVAVVPLLIAVCLALVSRWLFNERCRTRSAAVTCVAATVLLGAIFGVSAIPSLQPETDTTAVDVPLFLAATLATLLGSVSVIRPGIGPVPSSVVLLAAAGLIGGLYPFVPLIVLWWTADRETFRRPWWTLAAMIAAAIGLDAFRDDMAIAAASLVTITLIAAWAARPHRRLFIHSC